MGAPRRATCTPAELQALPLFRGLAEDQLGRLLGAGSCLALEAGPVYLQGDPADSLFVLLAGEVLRVRTHEGALVEVERSSRPGTFGGTLHALGDGPRSAVYADSMRVTLLSRFFVLADGKLVADPSRRELCGPATAGLRAALLLRSRVLRTQGAWATLAAEGCTGDELSTVLRVQREAVSRAVRPQDLAPGEAVDRLADLARWCEAYDVDDAWNSAVVLSWAGLGTDFLDEVLRQVGDGVLAQVVRWLSDAVESEQLIREIEESTRRVCALLGGSDPP